jgi:Glycosyltransferase like family 2
LAGRRKRCEVAWLHECRRFIPGEAQLVVTDDAFPVPGVLDELKAFRDRAGAHIVAAELLPLPGSSWVSANPVPGAWLCSAAGAEQLAANWALGLVTPSIIAPAALICIPTVIETGEDIVRVSASPLRTLADTYGLTWPHPETTPQTLTVVVRTQLKRPDALVQALACALAQTVLPQEIIVVVHSDDTTCLDRAGALLDGFDPTARHVVRIVDASGGRRGRPINVGFHAAVGDLVTLLDDDDVVTHSWASTFLHTARDFGSPSIIRARALQQPVRWLAETRPTMSPAGDLSIADLEPLRVAELLFRCRTPPSSVAYPRELMNSLGLRADDELELFEDWDLLVRTAQLTGYCDVSRITSVYRLDMDGGSVATEDDGATERSFRRMRAHIDASPLLLPKGSLRDLLKRDRSL